jgi:hypothetical protein
MVMVWRDIVDEDFDGNLVVGERVIKVPIRHPQRKSHMRHNLVMNSSTPKLGT